MAWTTPLTWLANQIVTAAELNTHVRDNLNELRNGGIAITSQAANDLIYATSATQFGRVAASTGFLRFNGTTWVAADPYPVGSVYENATDSSNPATLIGYGTWASLGAGRVLVGIDPSQTEFDTLGETGGAKTHTLTTSEMPAHAHELNTNASGNGSGTGLFGGNFADQGTIDTDTQGSGAAHNNLQPYIVVYRWYRTA